MTDSLLDGLTPAQREAVAHVDGPMLVVAGAGSGKTRVVTRRVAHLVRIGVKPWRILALTFTNKAAREMRERIEKLVGEAPAWMGTFHSICARILRVDIAQLGDGRNGSFTILDQADQEGLVKMAMRLLDLDDKDKSNKPSSILSRISRAKSDFIAPDAFAVDSWRDEIVQKVYGEYQNLLLRNNALDFDDLLVLTAKLLDTVPEALAKYRNRFPYLLVDEYQDTNRAQYRLLRALAGSRANLHATGDPDQSIYSWRGADYRNIMDFQRDFPGAKVVRLEQNYRSTKAILAAANRLIRNNDNRLDKDLYTENPAGEKVLAVALQSDRMEAMWIAEQMAELRDKGNRLGEMAVFYRTNAQSRPLEEALMSRGIPYQLVGGVRFYERKEVKDLLAHLKVRVNPRDLGSLRRVLGNRPGVGEKTLDKIAAAAAEADVPVFDFLAGPDFSRGFKGGKKVLDFAKWCGELARIDISRADVAVRDILRHSALIETAIAAADKDDLSEDRIENLHSLAARAGEFVQKRLEAAPAPDGEATEEEIRSAESIDLAAFLEDVALVADVDGWTGDEDKATLMTLHSAKGLEFDNVFIAGLEEGLLPHGNARTDEAVEEERRLFYVGITRARKWAAATRAATRFLHGSFDVSVPSRFLKELPADVADTLDLGDSLSLSYGSGFAPGGGKSAKNDPFKIVDEDFSDLDFDLDFDPDSGFAPDPDPGFDFPGGEPQPKAKRVWPAARAKPRPPAKPSRFKPGDLVRHPSFGSGKVLTADKGKIMVQFFGAGTRMIYEELAQLTKE